MTKSKVTENAPKKLMLASGGIFFGQGFAQLVSFARNVILARLLVPEDFGVVVTLVTTLTFFQMASDLAFDKFIIRNTEHDPLELRDVVHFLNISRGLLIGLIVALSGGLVAHIYGADKYWWMYSALGVLPVIKGFEHLDYKVAQRDINFWPEIKSMISSQAIGLLVSVLWALWSRNVFSLVVGSIAQYTVFVLMTHFLAKSPYRLSFSRPITRKIFAFGVPLILSGLVAFVGSQGDRVVIASQMGLRELAAYGSVALIIGSANLLLMAAVGSVALPVLSRNSRDAGEFAKVVDSYCIATYVIFSIFFVPMTICVVSVSRLLFGGAYVVRPEIAAMLSASVSISFFRAYLNTVLLSKGGTGPILAVNVVRALGVISGGVLVSMGCNLVEFLACMILAETAATVLSVTSLYKAGTYVGGRNVRVLALASVVLAATYALGAAFGAIGFAAVLIGAGAGVAAIAILLFVDNRARSLLANALETAGLRRVHT